MLPLNVLSKLVEGFAQSGATVLIKHGADDLGLPKQKVLADLEEVTCAALPILHQKFMDLGYGDLSKHAAMVSMVIATSSVMEMVREG